MLCKCGCKEEVGVLKNGTAKTYIPGHRNWVRVNASSTMCLCGCGGLTSVKNGVPYRYIYGHQARGEHNSRYGKTFSEDTKKKMSKKQLQRILEGRNPKVIPGWKHTEETISTLREIRKGTQKGSKNGFWGKKHSEATLVKMAVSQAAFRSKGGRIGLPTKPERLVHEALQILNIEFVTEFQVGKFCVDICIPTRSEIIFVDGCYWHGCPIHFPNKKCSPSDYSRRSYLEACGYEVHILWEHEIYQNVMNSLKRCGIE